MNCAEMKKATEAHISPTYGRFDVCLVKGRGCVGYDAEGKQYLDFGSGIGVNSLGFCDEEWKRAVSAQAATLQHTSNLYYTAPAARLAESLRQKTGMSKVFFANSGAEANEGAIKAARKYSHDKYGEGRSTVLALDGSFHGRTVTTLAATGQAAFHQHFLPFTEGFVHLPAGDLAAVEAHIGQGVCAVLVEMVQGEGGVVPLDKGYMKKLAALCRGQDVLLVADEVQTGAGRTGRFLASEHYGVQPDIVTLAKGLGGGLPLGAVLFSGKTAGTLGRGDHGSTYGANPVCCAGAQVVVDRLEPAFLAEVERKGALLKAGLEALPGVVRVDGLGLMLGIVLPEGVAAAEVATRAAEQGLLCLTAKHKLRLLPPLVVSDEEIDACLSILAGILEEMA